MKKQSEQNKEAWNYKAHEFWNNQLGDPEIVAEDMKARPSYYLRKHLSDFGELSGKKILNPLGSCGKKAIPLALLGGNVTVVDISEENKSYAMKLAEEAEVDIRYIVSDFLEVDDCELKEFFDIAYLEGGILHYFSDLTSVANKLYSVLKKGGKLVLNDFHPFRKILGNKSVFNINEEELRLIGNYFSDNLETSEVAYERYFSDEERERFPKCLLRYWTMGEIITSFASVGFVVLKLDEGPRFDAYNNLPGEFTLVCRKN